MYLDCEYELHNGSDLNTSKERAQITDMVQLLTHFCQRFFSTEGVSNVEIRVLVLSSCTLRKFSKHVIVRIFGKWGNSDKTRELMFDHRTLGRIINQYAHSLTLYLVRGIDDSVMKWSELGERSDFAETLLVTSKKS